MVDHEQVQDSDGLAPQQPPSLWSNRDYMGWWGGETLSAVGNSISTIAFPLVVLFTTGSVAQAGLISAANLLGSLLTTLWGGALADRVSRKAIMVIAPLVQAAAISTAAALVYQRHTGVLLLALTALVSGLAAGIGKGAVTPALRRIVTKEQVGAATGQELGRDMAAEFVGAPLGGMLFAVARWVPFVGDAVSFLFAALGAALIRRPLGPDRSGADTGTSLAADVRAGVAFVRQQPFLRFTVVWASLLNVVGQGFTLLFIALVRYRGGTPTVIGLVNSIALIGGVVGAVVGPVLLKQVRARTVLYVAGWTFVAALGLVAVAPNWWTIALVLFLAMLAVVPLNVVIETYVVRVVPDAYSGRVSAVNRFGAQLLQWTGPLLAGGLAAAFGAPGAALALMACTVPLALALHLSRSLTLLERPVTEVEEMTPQDAADAAGTATEQEPVRV